MQKFRELKVWQLSHSLVLDVYRVTGKFPAQEPFEKLQKNIEELARMLHGFRLANESTDRR